MIAYALDVQDLAAQGQNRLDIAATAILGRTACGVTLDDEQLGHLGIAHGAVGQLAGQARRLEQALAARGLASLTRGVAGLGRLLGLLDDLARLLGVFLEVVGKPLRHHLAHERAHEGAAQLGLGLALELRVGKLHGDDRRQALAHVVAREVGVLLLQDVLLARVIVDHAGECCAEALEVHAALRRVDVVREAHDRLGVRGVPLHRDLDLAGAVGRQPRLGRAGKVDGLLQAVGNVLALVQELDEVDDAARVAVFVHARRQLALVLEHDLQVLVQEGRLLQTVAQDVVVVDGGLEDLVIRPKRRGGARGLGRAHLDHLLRGLTAGELHLVDLAVAAHLNDHLLGQRVHDRHADAVQAAGHLVRRVVELAARVQDGHNDLERRDLLHRVLVHRDATAVVDDGDGVIGVNRDLDLGAEARHGLVDGVVDDLPHQVVQAAGACGTDVHARALADSLKTLEDLDFASAVFILFRHAHLPLFKKC